MADDIYYFGELHTVADPGKGPGGPEPGGPEPGGPEPGDLGLGGPGAQVSPLFLDQTEARKGENTFFGDRPPPQPLSEGLGPLLACTKT